MSLPLNPSPAQQKAFLTERGLSASTQAELTRSWRSGRFDHMLNDDGLKLRDLGYPPAVVLDAQDHYLHWKAADFYFHHHLNAHEAYLLSTDTQAVINLHDQPSVGAGSVFALLPAPYAFQIVFVAKSAKELAWYRDRHQHATAGKPMPPAATVQTVAALEAEVATFYAFLPPPPEVICCERGWT